MKKNHLPKYSQLLIHNRRWLRFGAIVLLAFVCSFLLARGIFSIATGIRYGSGKANVGKYTSVNSKAMAYLDPTLLLSYIDNKFGDYLLADTRSAGEYEAGHIKGAVNIPLYEDYKNTEQTKVPAKKFLDNFRKAAAGKRALFAYGYYNGSHVFIEGVESLRKNGFNVQVLAVSWYEFKNNVFSWLPGNDMGSREIVNYLEGSMFSNGK